LHEGSVTRVVAVTNQKGGVAKTTTVASLGAALGELDQRVLLVDLDPQACLTFSVGVDPEDLELTITEVLGGPAVASDALLRLTPGVDLLPSDIELTGTVLGSVGTLRDALRRIVRDYDWVLLDAPPSLGELTVSALVAAQEVLVPLQCETLSHRGLGQLLDTLHDVRTTTNRRLRMLGVLPTMFDGRTTHARLVLHDVATRYRLPILQPAIPRSVRFAEAPSLGRTVLETARRSPGAQAYRDLARGLLDGTARGTDDG
jgi:chromosome partitioning protein